MAYVSKEKKQEIKTALEKVMPPDWKWSLAVRDHRKAVLTISKAPVDLISIFCDSDDIYNKRRVDIYGEREVSSEYARTKNYYEVSNWSIERLPEGLQNRYISLVFTRIFEAMNTGNYDNSDRLTDYYDIGHYVEVQIGKWDRPFIKTEQIPKAA